MAELSCQQVVDLVTDYLEGALEPAERDDVEDHLRICEACVEYLDQMRVTLSLLGTVPLATLSDAARAALLDAFRDRD